MSHKWRLYMLRNRLTPTIIVTGLVMIGFGLLLYVRLDGVLRGFEQRVVEEDAHATADLYAERLGTELDKLSTMAEIMEQEEAVSDELEQSAVLISMARSHSADPNVFKGLLAADGHAIYGEELSLADYGGLLYSLRGMGGISYTPGGGVLFSCPVFHGNNVRYVLYELCATTAFEAQFPASIYNGSGQATVMTKDGDVVIPFHIQTPEDEAYFGSRSVRITLQRLLSQMEMSSSVVALLETTRGGQYFFASEIEGTDFVLAGVVDRDEIADGLVSVPMLVLLIFLLFVALVIALAFFLMVMAQRVQESDALKRARMAAEEASRAKSDFLANMSHEIRTPINTIMGMDEMILRECADSTIRKYAVNIQRAGKALLAQVNDVLDFSKIEAGKMELCPDEYDLVLVIADMVSMMGSRAVQKGLSFDVDVEESMPHILYGDSGRIRQVMINLLTNAVKYTKEGGIVFSIRFEMVDDEHINLLVTVQDTGIGIRKEDLDKLFSAFERIDEKRNRTIEGTGLGMNIVWKLLNLMGTKPKVESEYGKGSRFSFSVRQRVIDWEPVGDFQKAVGEAVEEEEYHSEFEAPLAKLLLVDDTEMNLMVVKGLLKNTGLSIDTAVDGKQALAMSEKKAYDVLLIDHRMPVMDGMEMIRLLRSREDNPNRRKPCIALTANAVAGAREEYLAAGFDDYLIKPVNGSRLEQMLMKYIPEDKLVPVGQANAPQQEPSQDSQELAQQDAPQEADSLDRIEEKGYLDVKEGIEYAGTREMYRTVLQFFVNSIDGKIEEIRGYYQAEDWENYRTKVHALKSSAKVIGADELSNRARALELAVNNEDIVYIREHTGDVLAFYGSYKEKLKGIG